MNRVVFGLLIVCSISCSKKVTGQKAQAEELGCEWNESRVYVLCLIEGNQNPKSNERTISFIIKNKDNEVVESGSIDSGSVKWLDDKSIEIFQTPGMIPTQITKDDLTKVFVISTKTYLSKTEYLESK